MNIWEVILLGLALSMDACAVAMSNGMSDSKMPAKRAVLIGIFFGFFQFLMPVIGYFITDLIANAFLDTFESISAWISFVLLAFLGGKMLYEGISEWLALKNASTDGCENCDTVGAGTCSMQDKPQKLTLGKLFMQAIATSIDALAVGVTLKMAALSEIGLALGVWGATGVVGVLTCGLSIAAVYIGKAVGNKLADKAEVFGGAVLLAIGLKILIESFI